MYDATFHVELLPTSQLNTRSSHWGPRAREAREWDRWIHLKSAGKRPALPLRKARLTLVRHSATPSDWDNLAASWKHPVDALVSCGILFDDSWSVIGVPEFRWEKAPRNKGFVTIRVQEVE